ncbi:UAA transporter family-domain-containing protein [Hyaloraphidium curvatum]|nr:UAA transporter family-domain-containing protein [Hyaloraphidium curvatum]
MSHGEAPADTMASSSLVKGGLSGERMRGLLLTAGGIMGAFLVYGVIQEKIMTTPYGPNGERFTNTAFLVLINRLVSIAVAASLLKAKREPPEAFRPIAPLSSYVMIAGCNFMATFCQYEALKFLSFPTQTLGKCGKMVPVMIIGYFAQKKKYSAVDWGTMLAITLGCTVFLISGDITASHKKGSDSDTPLGLLLLLTYLFFDGFTSTSQEKLFKGYKMSSNHQMLFVGSCSAALSIFLLMFPIDRLITTGKFQFNNLGPSLSFAFNYPALLFDALILSAASTGGQSLIYHCIKEYGALVYSTIMTTRQLISVMLSTVLFAHPLSLLQWLSSFVVFGSLYYKSYAAANKPDKRSSAPGADGGAKAESEASLLPIDSANKDGVADLQSVSIETAANGSTK